MDLSVWVKDVSAARTLDMRSCGIGDSVAPGLVAAGPGSRSGSGPPLTCVNPYPESQLVVGSVADLEGLDLLQQRQRHPGNLSGVELPVPHRQPGHDHVGVADGLHLRSQSEAYCSAVLFPGVSYRSVTNPNSPYKHRNYRWWRRSRCTDRWAAWPPAHRNRLFIIKPQTCESNMNRAESSVTPRPWFVYRLRGRRVRGVCWTSTSLTSSPVCGWTLAHWHKHTGSSITSTDGILQTICTAFTTVCWP